MQWSDVVSKVLIDLPVDKERIGIATGNPNYLGQQIIHCITRIQQNIPFYQGGHETVYGTEDLVLNGLASVGRLPDGARPLDGYYKAVGRQCVSQPLTEYDWGNRYDLICGNPKIIRGQFLIAMDQWGKEFIVFPSVFDEHQISLFWSGVKESFADSDETPFDDGVVECVGLFVKAKIARMVDHDLSEQASYMGEFIQKQRLIYADSRSRNRFSLTGYSPGQASKCANAITSCQTTPQTPIEDTTEFCAFGDSGEPATIANTNAVANLVKSLEPDFVMHLGDTNYPSGDPPQFQDVLIKQYGLYIPSDFLLAYGNHDIETDAGAFLYSLLPRQVALNSGKNYYSFIPRGEHAQIFVLDTNGDPGEQAAWLELMLSQSSYWNIVCMHKSPWTSDVIHAPGDPDWRFPFKDWGAHVVISAHGHNYERLWVDGFQYIVSGLGGAPKRDFVSPPTAGSQFRYNSFYGTTFVTATRTRMQVTFFDTRGESVDSVQWETAPEFGLGPQPPIPPPNPGTWCQLRGAMAPEGVVVANTGCWFRRNDGINSEFWFKDLNDNSPFGWILVEKLA